MRIAFLGKGGSGKTTTAAGFVRFAAQEFPFVLAVDADVNAHLRGALHLDNLLGEEHQLGEMCDTILDYVRGDRTDLGDRPMIATLPPSLKSRFISVNADDPFIKQYAQHGGNIHLLTVGTYKDSDVGGSCYHTKLRGLAAFFHHLLDRPTDIVIADTTAGTDNVATSLSLAYDMNVFVVEPTEKSINVYRDYIELAPWLSERTYIIANKVEGLEDEAFIYTNLPKDRVLGIIPNSKHLKRFEQGNRSELELFHKEQLPVFDSVMEALKQRKRDWKTYLELLKATNEKVARDWYNAYYSCRLDENLDPDFSYEAAMYANNR